MAEYHSDDIDDMLGTEPEEEARRVMPAQGRDVFRLNDFNVNKVHLIKPGVSVQWLAVAFEMKATTVRHRLMKCPILRGTGRTELYDLATAASYLVEPSTKLADYMKTLKVEQLPERLREPFWNAKIKELKYMALAGEAWHTTDVMNALSEVFSTIKNQTQLWTEHINESEELTPKQYKVVQNLVNTLVDDIKTKIVEMSKSGTTKNIAADLDDVE